MAFTGKNLSDCKTMPKTGKTFLFVLAEGGELFGG
jgi:hypothetical protein